MKNDSRKIEWGNIPENIERKETREVDWGDESNDSSKSEQVGLAGVGNDIKNIIKNIPNILSSVPKEISGINDQYEQEPGRIGKNLAAGVGELGIGTLNTPHNIIQYLGKKELIPEWLNKYNDLPFTHIPNLGIEEKIGIGEKKPGDELLKFIPQLLTGHLSKKLLTRNPGKELEVANNFIEKTEGHHKKFLGEGQEHGARTSQKFLDYIEGEVNPENGKRVGGLRREIGSKYENLKNDMMNERVAIERSPDFKSIEKEISSLGKGVTESEKENLFKVLSGEKTKNVVSGADALTSYREIKNQIRKANQRAYSPGVGPKEHVDWIEKSKKLTSLEKKMKDTLEKQLGGKYLERLKNIDREYAEKIAPLYANDMYVGMKKHGQTSKDIMKYLQGTTPGNNTLNALVANDTELQRLIVGQKFSQKPNKLAGNNEIVKNYEDMNPYISKIIEEQRQIKDLKENHIPSLIESVKKAHESKIKRRSSLKGVGATIGTIGAGAAIESALGRDWKKDLPYLTNLLAAKHISKKSK